MPSPFDRGAGVSPLPSLEGSGAGADSPSASGSGCGAAGLAAGSVGVFFAPGLRAPRGDTEALDLRFGLGHGKIGVGGVGLGIRLSLVRIDVRRLRAVASPSVGAALRRCLLGAGSLGTRGDAEALDLGASASAGASALAAASAVRRRFGSAGAAAVFLAPVAWRRPRCRAPSPVPPRLRRAPAGCGRRLLGTRALRAARDAEAGDRLGFRSVAAAASAPARPPVRPRRSRLRLGRRFAGVLAARSSASSAAVPFSGSVTVLVSSEPSSSWATSSTSAFSHVLGRGDVVDAVGHHHPAERAAGGDLGRRRCPAPPRRVRG